MPLPGELKLIKCNSHGVDDPDDPSYPFRLEVDLRPPEFMQIAFLMLHGEKEELVVRARTRAAIDRFLDKNDLRHHPRLRRAIILGPDGTKDEIRPTR